MRIKSLAAKLQRLQQQQKSWAHVSHRLLSSSSGSQSADAEFALGVKHFLGKADPSASTAPSSKSPVQYAVLHWTNAALQGHVKAQSALGNLYMRGHQEIRRDEKLAQQFLAQAAAAGHASSCHELGKLYFYGSDAVDIDLVQALHYWTIAAEKGYVAASFDLAYMYERGIHVAQDVAKCVTLYQQAASKGMPEAHLALGKVYLQGRSDDSQVPQNLEKAVTHFRTAAEAGFPPAQFDLGACYMLGRGLARDFQQAARLFFLAAEAGIPEAQLCLAQLFEHGNGVAADRAKAVQYYQIAGQNGLSEAKVALDRLGEPHEPPQQKAN